MSLSARIEKNRLALMALLAPWFAFAAWHCMRGDKPLPRRVAAYALWVVGAVEQAAGCLLIASAHDVASHMRPRRSADLHSKALCLAKIGMQCAPPRLTIDALNRRLARVWRVLRNLYAVARCLAARLARQSAFAARAVSIGADDAFAMVHKTGPQLPAPKPVPP